MIVVAVGSMSLVIALSVFNGLEGLLRSLYGNFDPDVVVTPLLGKSFEYSEDLGMKMEEVDGVEAVTLVIEDNVLVQYRDAQRLVKMKGVSGNFEQFSNIRNAMVNGEFSLIRDSIPYALIGRGVQYDLSLSMNNEFYSLQLYYPRNIAPGVVNPERLYRLKNIMPGGVFAIEKFYDENYIFVPLEFARELLSYDGKLSSFEIKVRDGFNADEVKYALSQQLGDEFVVKTGDELHTDLYKTLEIEKLFVFITFTAIIAIASVNIFFSLTMLVIEKKKDISVLVANGASSGLIRKIFLYEGGIVSLSGALVGIILGLGFSLAQQEFGIVGMGMETAVMQSYPVKVEWPDVLITGIVIVVITILASIQPALKASRSFASEALQ